MGQADLRDGSDPDRAETFSVASVMAEADNVISGYDPDVVAELERRVAEGQAVAIMSKTKGSVVQKFVGCAMAVSEGCGKAVVVYIDGSADVFATEGALSTSAVQTSGSSEVEVDYVFDLNEAEDMGGTASIGSSQLWMFFASGSTPVSVSVDHPDDIMGVRTGLYATLSHDRSAWRSTIFSSQQNEVAVALSIALNRAAELQHQREISSRRIGKVILSARQGSVSNQAFTD